MFFFCTLLRSGPLIPAALGVVACSATLAEPPQTGLPATALPSSHSIAMQWLSAHDAVRASLITASGWCRSVSLGHSKTDVSQHRKSALLPSDIDVPLISRHQAWTGAAAAFKADPACVSSTGMLLPDHLLVMKALMLTKHALWVFDADRLASICTRYVLPGVNAQA